MQRAIDDAARGGLQKLSAACLGMEPEEVPHQEAKQQELPSGALNGAYVLERSVNQLAKLGFLCWLIAWAMSCEDSLICCELSNVRDVNQKLQAQVSTSGSTCPSQLRWWRPGAGCCRLASMPGLRGARGQLRACLTSHPSVLMPNRLRFLQAAGAGSAYMPPGRWKQPALQQAAATRRARPGRRRSAPLWLSRPGKPFAAASSRR